MKKYWKPKHSVTLSLVVTYLAGAALLALMVCVPGLMNRWRDSYYEIYDIGLHPASLLLFVFYACCPAGWAAIVSLLMLLHNIRKGEVFTRKNVKLLRRISWCFVFTALAAIYATCFYFPCAVIIAASGFLAVILRVVKNVMEQATIMREEQELTI
ncbi:MAG: DUF2975 domain-containing protein [Firmicutes bacterium]|nr:DUF2975 domain-containing protein [Bacillota bacterium]